MGTEPAAVSPAAFWLHVNEEQSCCLLSLSSDGAAFYNTEHSIRRLCDTFNNAE